MEKMKLSMKSTLHQLWNMEMAQWSETYFLVLESRKS